MAGLSGGILGVGDGPLHRKARVLGHGAVCRGAARFRNSVGCDLSCSLGQSSPRTPVVLPRRPPHGLGSLLCGVPRARVGFARGVDRVRMYQLQWEQGARMSECLICCRTLAHTTNLGGDLCWFGADDYQDTGDHARAMAVVLGALAFVRWVLEVAPRLCERNMENDL